VTVNESQTVKTNLHLSSFIFHPSPFILHPFPMSNPRKPFRFNVGFIVHGEVGYTHEFPFEFEEIQLGGDLELRNFEGAAHVSRTPQGLLLQANFSAETTLECVRCLSEFNHALVWEITELYAFNAKSVTESELILPEDAHIDLESLVRECAILEFPISPICKPDCKGLCIICGENLNLKDCGHRPEQSDSPFSALKKLL